MPDSNTTSDSSFTGGGEGFPADNPDGTPGLVGPSDSLRRIMVDKYTRPANQSTLGGNYADLQRLGANLAGGPGTVSTFNAVLDTGPGVDPKAENIVTPAQSEAARGEWTRETERVGLLDAPPEFVPAENTSPNPVDPTATSPTVETKGSSGSSATKAPEKK